MFRIVDIKQAISDIRSLLSGRTYEDMLANRPMRAALERYFEIISEASRGVPESWRAQHGAEIAWGDIRNIGKILRHAYRHVDHTVLWNIYERDLDPLEAAIDAMISRYGQP